MAKKEAAQKQKEMQQLTKENWAAKEKEYEEVQMVYKQQQEEQLQAMQERQYANFQEGLEKERRKLQQVCTSLFIYWVEEGYHHLYPYRFL